MSADTLGCWKALEEGTLVVVPRQGYMSRLCPKRIPHVRMCSLCMRRRYFCVRVEIEVPRRSWSTTVMPSECALG